MRNPKRTTHSTPHAYDSERSRLPNPQLGIEVAPNSQRRISLSRLDSSLQAPQKELALTLRTAPGPGEGGLSQSVVTVRPL